MKAFAKNSEKKLFWCFKSVLIAVVILVMNVSNVQAQYSSSGWSFIGRGDGTATLLKPQSQTWKTCAGCETGTTISCPDSYVDNITSFLSFPSSVTEMHYAYDSESCSFVAVYGKTYTVTEISNSLTAAQRQALVSVSIPGTVTTIAPSAFKDCNFSSITIPSSVTTIGHSAFENTPLTSVTIPASVTSMGVSVFKDCTVLKSAIIQNKVIGDYQFENSALESITIPAAVTSMGYSVFRNCTALRSATVLNSSISYYQFQNCTALKDVTFSDNLTTVGFFAFANCPSVETLTVPASVTSIAISTGIGSFAGLTGLKTLNYYAKNAPWANFSGLPIETLDLTGVETIDFNAFQNCTKLKNVVLSESLKSIGNSAFENDSSLVSVIVPASVTSMGHSVFRNCTSLQSATVLNSAIGSSQFWSCTALKDVIFSNNLKTIGRNAFATCPSVETLTIPESVTSIEIAAGIGAFTGMVGLKTLNFHAKNVPWANFSGLPIETLDLTGAENIEFSAFENCGHLKNITLSNSLKTINQRAFANCYDLQRVTIPSSVSTMNQGIFANCTNLQELTVRWETPFVFTNMYGNYPFYNLNTSRIRLNVPDGTKDAYRQATGWKDFYIETGRIQHYTPNVMGNDGNISMSIYGTPLTEAATVELIQNGNKIKAVSVLEPRAGEYVAMFEFNQIPTGKYDLRVQQPNAVDTLIANAVTIQGIVYPKVVSSIQGNLNLRTGLKSTVQLELRNTGNIDALGVNAYIAVPDAMEVEMTRKNFLELIDDTKSFNYYCEEFGQNISISNADIIQMANLLNIESLPVDSVFEEPFDGKIYQMYVPKVPAGGTVSIPIRLKALRDIGTGKIISAVETPNVFNPVYSTDSIPVAIVSKLNNYVDLFISTMDLSVLTNTTDPDAWIKTFIIAEDLVRKILADDRDRKGYDTNKLETIDNNYYNNGLPYKQMATFMLTLITIAEENSIEQRTDGIINFASVPTEGYQNAKMASVKQAPRPGTPEYDAYAERQRNKVENWLQWNFNEMHNPEQNIRDSQSSEEGFWNNIVNSIVKIFIEKGLGKVPEPLDQYIGQAPDVASHGHHVIKNPHILDELLDHGMDTRYQYTYENNGRKDAKKTPVISRNSYDPNDITGPFGITDERYIPSSETMNYLIRFENKAEAGLPAMFVNVYDTLDVNKYDLHTFEFGNIQIGDTTLIVPRFKQSYYREYDMRPRFDYFVGITAKLDTETGVAHWFFETLDLTRATVEDPEAGFLPPNINAPEGEGSVSFSVKLKENLPHNTVIENQADIIFDFNETITTNLWENTLDLVPPVSSVAIEQLSDSTFKVKWTGEDAESGVSYHKLYAKINDDKFFPIGSYFSNEAIFLAMPDTLYSFYVEAVDYVGNAESKPAVAEVSVKLTPSGIKTVKKQQQIVLYPNPVKDELRIANDEIQYGDKIEIVDLLGSKVSALRGATSLHNGTVTINVSALPAGIYILKVGSRWGKFVKE